MIVQNKMTKILIFCNIAFVLYGAFNIIAMFFYAGGTAAEPISKGYNFFNNFFSDLGRINSYNGNLNIISALFFSSALVLMGIALILFFLITKNLFTNNPTIKYIIRFTTIFGILSGTACAGIGILPQDLLPILHIIIAYCFSGLFLLALIFFTIGIFLNNKYPRIYTITPKNLVFLARKSSNDLI